jgi:hypothetical protein
MTGARTGRFKRQFIPLKNEPGQMAMLDKRSIYIDRDYQRKLNDLLVIRIAGNWSWVSCGVLLVSQRPGDKRYFVIDGQHRWQAAMKLTRIKELPCIVFQLDTVRDEATGFLAANTERRMPSLAEQFNALIATGDKTALLAKQLAEKHNRKVSAPTSPTTISAVSDFLNCLSTNQSAMQRVFPTLAQVCVGRAMTGRLIKGLWALERRMPKGQSLSDKYWRDRLVHVGYDELVSSMKLTITLEGKSSEQAMAQGILRAINRNLRNPLAIDMNKARWLA